MSTELHVDDGCTLPLEEVLRRFTFQRDFPGNGRLSGGVESQDARSLTASARHADSACKHVESTKDGVRFSALVSPDNVSGSSAPPAQFHSPIPTTRGLLLLALPNE